MNNKIIADSRFKVGDIVRGRYKKLVDEDYKWFNYTGTIIEDMGDGSYVVRTPRGEEVLIELYFDETMELV